MPAADTLYAKASATDPGMQVSVDKAINAARANLVDSLETITEAALFRDRPSNPRAATLRHRLVRENRAAALKSRLKGLRRPCTYLMQCLATTEESPPLIFKLRDDLQRSQEAVQRDDGSWQAFVVVAVPVERIAQTLPTV